MDLKILVVLSLSLMGEARSLRHETFHSLEINHYKSSEKSETFSKQLLLWQKIDGKIRIVDWKYINEGEKIGFFKVGDTFFYKTRQKGLIKFKYLTESFTNTDRELDDRRENTIFKFRRDILK